MARKALDPFETIPAVSSWSVTASQGGSRGAAGLQSGAASLFSLRIQGRAEPEDWPRICSNLNMEDDECVQTLAP